MKSTETSGPALAPDRRGAIVEALAQVVLATLRADGVLPDDRAAVSVDRATDAREPVRRGGAAV